ncbi:MAG: GDSL-type esterase/lipase family protein, partial [Clostridia bacterium]|nr:GDSL-type esterase/lipase family protein [Clostridia bacterium]
DAKYFSGAAFLGDSLTEGLEYFSVMDDATLLGETGLSTYTALTHPQTIGGKKVMVADAVKAAKPSVIYVMLGSNEINWMAQGDYIKYYDKLIDTLQKGSPQAQIEIESILPVTASYEKRYPDRSNSHIDQFNGALRLMCNSRGLKFLDIASVMKDEDGKLPSSASDDGIHLRAPYYNRWISYLLANK